MLLLGLYGLAASAGVKVSTLTSPGGKLEVRVTTDGQSLKWEVKSGDTQVLAPSAIQAVVDGKAVVTGSGSVSRQQQVHSSFVTPVYQRQQVDDNYGLLVMKFGGGTTVEFRAYDDAAAYRICLGSKKATRVDSELVEYCFAGDYQAYVPYVNDLRAGERYSYSFESYYDEQQLSQLFRDSLAITPLAVRLPGGKLAVVMDAGVEDYPGMMLKKGMAPNSLVAEFAPWVLEQRPSGLNLIPTRRAPYLAKISGQRTLPWRAVVVVDHDAQLLDCDIAMRLAPAQRLKDTSWIKPGKVAWDWWNNTNIWGVDFESGMNTPTYKHYIDFAQQNKLEYIIIDEGWSGRESLTDNLNPAIDLRELVSYGNSRGVGIILWSSWRNMIGNDAVGGGIETMERYMQHYSEMGIKGFKVDFFDRDDQQCIASAYRMAECAARHHLLLDYHGLKPMGVQRPWPNVLNFEGVKGLENSKWEPRDGRGPLHNQPAYDVTIPYLRMLCGQLDYTPGAMDNATSENFFGNNGHPMSQGTRAHQVAMYVVFEAPLQMLADSPTKYRREQETTDFISRIPTTFDETVALDGRLGQYVVIARRKGTTWYVGAMSAGQVRELTIDLSFLGDGSHQADIFADGVNALNSKEAMDYRCTHQRVGNGDKLQVKLAPDGGWAAIIR